MQTQNTLETIYNPKILEAVHERRFKDAIALTTERNSQIWLMKGQPRFSELTNWVSIEDIFTKDLLQRKQGLSEEGQGLVFIMGLPRSGKTTLETLLAEIIIVQAGGELPYLQEQFAQIQGPDGKVWTYPDYIPFLPDKVWAQFGGNYANPVRETVKNADFIIDTMPSTFRYVGLIALMLPKAKIIHMTRSPLEHGIDIFSKVFDNEFYNFTYDWDTLATYYIAYRALMAHWNHVLGSKILTVNFDELAANPKKELRKVIDFCGIESDISPSAIAKKYNATFSEIKYMNAMLKNYRPFLKEFEKKLSVFRRL